MSTRTGTTGIAPFVIQDDAIPQPAAYADQLNKGWHTRNTLAERNAIPLYYRGWGMVCVVTNNGNSNGVYQLTRPSSDIADDDDGALMDNGNWVVLNSNASDVKTFSTTNGIITTEQYAQMQPGDLIFDTDNNTGYLRNIQKVVPPGKSWQNWFGSGYSTPQRVENVPADDWGNENDIAVIVYNNINNDNHWASYYIKSNGSWQFYLDFICDSSPFITDTPTGNTNPVNYIPAYSCYAIIDDITYIPYVFNMSIDWLASVSITPSVDSQPFDNSQNIVQSGGVKSYVDNIATRLTGRIFDDEPAGGWKVGDIWLFGNAAGILLEVRKITSDVYGWASYQPYAPLNSFVAFSPTYNVLTPLDVNGNNGDYCWMAAYPTAPYGPKNGNIWIEYFKKINGHWVSQLQIISSVSPYSNGHTTATDGVIVNTGDRIAMSNSDGGVHVYKYYPAAYTVLARNNQVITLPANPTVNDILSNTFSVIKNTTTGNTNLWLNDGGVLKSIAFT